MTPIRYRPGRGSGGAPPHLPPGGAQTTTCCYTAQDLCLIKNPRSEAMQRVIANRYPLLCVMAHQRRGGGGALPHSPVIVCTDD